MRGKTFWQWLAAISFLLGISCFVFGLVTNGPLSVVAIMAVQPLYLIAIYCVIFHPADKHD